MISPSSILNTPLVIPSFRQFTAGIEIVKHAVNKNVINMKTSKVSVRKMVAAIAVSFGVLFAGSAAAQEQQTTAESGLKAKFGVKAGVNLSNLYVDDVKDQNM
ncbi:MAG: hypothetical protein EOP48_15795, partial [Sphingobacteriales bacterium]